MRFLLGVVAGLLLGWRWWESGARENERIIYDLTKQMRRLELRSRGWGWRWSD